MPVKIGGDRKERKIVREKKLHRDVSITEQRYNAVTGTYLEARRPGGLVVGLVSWLLLELLL
jgi:hypothetical protein